MAFSHSTGDFGEPTRRRNSGLKLVFEVQGRLDRVGMIGPRALALDEFAKEPDRDELEGGHDQEHSEHQKRPVADRAESEDPENAKIGEDGSPGEAEDRSGGAEDMQRPCRETRVEHDAEEVEGPLEETVEAVFRTAELPRMMVDGDFADPVAAPVKQDRNEPVKFAIEREAFESFRAVGLEAAVEIVELDAAQAADHQIEDPRGQGFVDGIVADAFPAGNHVAALMQLCDESRDLLRIVLQVGVHRDDEFAARRREACIQRGGLAKVPAERDASDVVERPRKRLQPLRRSVRRAVVHEDDLVVEPGVGHYGPDPLAQQGKRILLVVDRNDDRDPRPFGRICGNGLVELHPASPDPGLPALRRRDAKKPPWEY